MIDFPLLQVAEPHRSIGVRLAFDELAALAPGRDAGLDAICEGILERVPFEAKTRGAAVGAAT